MLCTTHQLYGDRIYLGANIKSAYNAPDGVLTDAEFNFNLLMSSIRQHEEFGFGALVQNFKLLDSYKQLMILKRNVGWIIGVCMILQNCYVCLNGSKTSLEFNMKPPSLEEYLQ
jgi:hypothetical protein